MASLYTDDATIEDVNTGAIAEQFTPPLLSLPAEVRNLIFSFVLTNHHIHLRYVELPSLHWSVPRSGYFYHHLLDIDRPPPYSSETALRAPAYGRTGQLTPLWRVCKQLHAETLNLPFSRANIFSFEDRTVMARFVARAGPERLAGIRRVWVVDDTQSATCMELLAPRLAEAQGESRLADMTIYIHSRIRRMEDASSDPYSGGPLSTWVSLRAGWDLSFERKMVNGLREMWEKLVAEVVVREV